MTDFTKFENRFYIEANFVLDKPLHIGRGISLKPIGTDLPVIKDANDKPYIPGSSIKGIIRSELERILIALDIKKNKFGVKNLTCDVLDKEKICVNDDKKKELMKKHTKANGNLNDDGFTRELWNETCLVCRLFGSPWIASRIYIKDMHLLNSDIRTEIRDGVAIDRDTGTAKLRMKFDYEIVPSGAKFRFEVILENVEDWEVGLFCLILRLWEKGEIAIGGKTSSGLGWGKLENIKIEKIDANNLLDYILGITEKKPVEMENFIRKFKEKLEGKNA
jgi:CRISPR-associated RAMP protein (TIGR02581 family)